MDRCAKEKNWIPQTLSQEIRLETIGGFHMTSLNSDYKTFDPPKI